MLVGELAFNVVIPARYESQRLPGKVLRKINGRTMLEYVWRNASASGATETVIATDNELVAECAEGFGAKVCMTSAACNSGTDRVAETSNRLGWGSDAIIVNAQGDAPLLPAQSIRTVAELLQRHPSASLATLCTPLDSADAYHDPNVVKVVFDQTGRALYFSRAPIPAVAHGNDPEQVWRSSWRHLGLYAYRAAALSLLAATEPAPLELTERLEQLRALWLGLEIRIAPDAQSHGPDVDIEADLQRVASLLDATSGA